MNFQFWLFNKLIIDYQSKSAYWLPMTVIAINGITLNYGQKQNSEYGEPYREVGFTFPLHLLVNKSDVNVAFSIGFGFIFSINYQWSY